MSSTQSTSDEPTRGTGTLLGAAAVLFTLLLLVIGGGVALYARLEGDPQHGEEKDGTREEQPSSAPGSGPSRTRSPDGRRLTRTRVRQLEGEQSRLRSEHTVLVDQRRNLFLPEDRAMATARMKVIERRLDEIERTLRERR